MKHIEVTNISQGRVGDPLLINTDHIICVYEDHEEGGSLRTKIFGVGGIVWEVEQSYFEVKKLIALCSNKVSG